MADVGRSAVRIIDSDNDVVSVTNNKLDVNATVADGGAIEIEGHDVVFDAAINLSDSAAQLSGIACKHVDIMANLSNTGIVYIGASGVDATQGIALYPGDVYSVDITNLNLLYAFSTVSGDDINVVGFV